MMTTLKTSLGYEVQELPGGEGLDATLASGPVDVVLPDILLGEEREVGRTRPRTRRLASPGVTGPIPVYNPNQATARLVPPARRRAGDATPETAMKFPYGLSDFGTLIQAGYWYQDRTDRIASLEEAGRQLIFLRPRRFGKSLLLSLLEHCYDLNRAGQFAALFGKLAVGREPTDLHNQFFVMRWDFSLVQAQGEVGEIEAALHQHLNDCIHDFAQRYREQLPHEIEIHADNALSSWRALLTAVAQTPHKLYLLIDEYDNFANEVLMTDRDGSRDRYQALLYGEGLLKTVFKAVKAAAGGMGLDRVFITCVSPIVLSDMTSGYNVGKNIYLDADFNDLCGFTAAEVERVLAQLAAEGAPLSPTEALATMRTFYNGYRFSEEATESLYNPTLSLYFLKALGQQGQYPRRVLDENLAMDRT